MAQQQPAAAGAEGPQQQSFRPEGVQVEGLAGQVKAAPQGHRAEPMQGGGQGGEAGSRQGAGPMAAQHHGQQQAKTAAGTQSRPMGRNEQQQCRRQQGRPQG